MNLPQGALLQGGKYRIERFISSGGFGCTYEAQHTMLEKRVAIKEFFVKDFCNRDEVTAHVTVATQGKRSLVAKLRHKFADEAKALARMQHPGIVNVSDVFEENGTAYYVMDYVDGSSLQEILRHEERLSEERALGYIRQVADALSYVHKQNRLHLDVKPGNIMVDTEGNAVLIDFGASKQYDELDGENTSTVQGYTKGFAPPEQMTNDVVKFMPATDIYALGATLHKLLTGVTPPNATLRISGEPLEALPASVCAATANAIEQSMRLNKMQRPQSIEEFLALLDAPATVADDGQAKPAEEDTEVYAHDSESVDEDGDKIQDETPDVNDNDVSHPFSSMGEHASDTGYTTAKKSLLKRLLWPVVVGVIAVVIFFGVQAYNNLRAENARLAAIEKHRLDSIAKLKKAEEERLELLRCDSLSLIPTGVVNGYEYVDLGLSVKWAMCNVGASSPSECGDRYAWGETSTKMQFAESNSTTYGKSMSCIAGNSNHDVACAKWGDDWRLPTREEFQELLNKCTWTWTTVDDVNGYCVTGPNGENIFLPIVGDYGDYWSSTPHETNPAHSYHFYFSGSECRLYAGGRRYSGLCIRPVLGKIERKADEQKVKEDKKQTSSAPKSEQKENTSKPSATTVTQPKKEAEEKRKETEVINVDKAEKTNATTSTPSRSAKAVPSQPNPSPLIGTSSGTTYSLFFPAHGVLLGKTTIYDIEALGNSVGKYKGGTNKIRIDAVDFEDNNGDRIFEEVKIERGDMMPEKWQLLGLNWNLSYNEWLALFEKMNFTIEDDDRGTRVLKRYDDNEKMLVAEFDAVAPDQSFKMHLHFWDGGYGYRNSSGHGLNSKRTLNRISIKLLNPPSTYPANPTRTTSLTTIPTAHRYFSDFFPVYGITLGKTKVADMKNLAGWVRNDYGKHYTNLNTLDFWDEDKDGVFECIVMSGEDMMPEKWKQLGMNFSLSYNEWLVLFEKMGFNTTSWDGSLYASPPDKSFEMQLCSFSTDDLNVKNSLNTIIIRKK